MCGIAGFFCKQGLKQDAGVARLSLERMSQMLAHRGPDDTGIWQDSAGLAGFAHTRLAILDLSETGSQPMSDMSGRYTVCCNGEIYNHQEIRKDLVQRGIRFRGTSDTETLVNAFAVYGPEVLSRLNGMFAFAIWDARERSLFLARDRLGKKPLYYSNQNGCFLFGSEIKAILCWPGIVPEPDYKAINYYLSLQYVPSPLTAFKNIFALPPAHSMTLTQAGRTTAKKYWQLPSPGQEQQADSTCLAGKLDCLLGDAVNLRRLSDVPVGAFLSGGLDSSSVVAHLAFQEQGPVDTFCIGFNESLYDERAKARQIAERYGTRHHEYVVTPDIESILPRLSWHFNQPFADPSAVPALCVSELARHHVKVALSGDGGDELFLGYTRYAIAARTAWVERLPAPVRRLLHLAGTAGKPGLDKVRYLRGVRRLARYAASSRSSRYGNMMFAFLDEQRQPAFDRVLAPCLEDNASEIIAMFLDDAETMLSGAAWADLHSYLPDDLLVKVDVTSMAFGLETRVPFLDYRLVEWAARVPETAKYKDGELKAILRRAEQDRLPEAILRQEKMGFGFPVNEWLRRECKPLVEGVLLDGSFAGRGLVKPDFMHQMINDHNNRRALHHTRIWALLMLENWFRMWIDNGAKEGLSCRPEFAKSTLLS